MLEDHGIEASILDLETPLLDGRAIVVTGSGNGFGRDYAIAAALHGATLVVGDIDVDAAERTAEEVVAVGGTVEVVNGDIGDWAVAEATIERCIAAYGKIDCLVNNAGVYNSPNPWDDTETGIREVVDTNLLGTMFPGTHAIKRMHAQGFGVILNTSSGNGQSGKRDSAAYCATKAAVATLTYTWALSLRSHGVRVNAICPTGSTPAILATETAVVTWPSQWASALALFLISDLSAPMTGQVVRLWDRELAVMTHPKLATPVLESSTPWSVHQIAHAFQTELQAAVQPISLADVDPQVSEA